MRLSSGHFRHSRSRLNATLIGVVEMPRGVGPTGGKGSSSSRISSPSIVGSTLMATRSTGASGLASASHSAGSGTGKNEIVERVIDIDLVAEIGPLLALTDEDNVRRIHQRGAGHRLRDADHLHALDKRRMHSLVNRHLIEKAGEPLGIIILAVHPVLRCYLGCQSIRLQHSS